MSDARPPERPPNPTRPQDDEALWALRRRALPDGAVDGLYAAIREHTPYAWGSGGAMSLRFLDAPRALRVWRTTALAASMLLAFGVGVWATGTLDRPAAPAPVAETTTPEAAPLPVRPTNEHPLVDARPALLPPAQPAPAPTFRYRPASPTFFGAQPAPAVRPVSSTSTPDSRWD